MHNGTIEEEVLSLHEENRQLAASVLDGADVAARLDGDDLLDRAETRHSQRDTSGLLRLKSDTSIPMKNA